MSGLGWIDFSAEHRARVHAVLDLLRTPGVIDELGVGGIRDSFSDCLFPGISTIQTRAKYFVLVPYILKDFADIPRERRRETAVDYLRRRELECIKQLVKVHAGEEVIGIIGATLEGSARELKRKPSSTYWGGIRNFGLIHTGLGLRDFLLRLNDYQPRHRLYGSLLTQEDDVPADAAELDGINTPHDPNWAANLRIQLTVAEADLLRDRIRWSVRSSLLAAVLEHDAWADEFGRLETGDFASLLSTSFYPHLPPQLREAIVAARDFWTLLEGAHIRYNLLLQQRYNEGSEARETDWREWRERLAGDADLRRRWSTLALWDRCKKTGRNIPARTKSFVAGWTEAVLSESWDEARLDALVVGQESFTKGARARLRRGGERVSSQYYGLRTMLFRLPQAARMVLDIRQAQSGVATHA